MKIYNTLTKSKEEFIPINPGEVRMYVCGPTVYNYFHIGNGRTFIVFDTVRRYLEWRGYRVKFVQNFTDIDDKMINRANEEGISVKELGDKFIAEYYKDADNLNIERATVNPRATEYMEEIISFVSDLVDKGYAYEINGDVYFDTSKFKDYGKLSGQKLEDLLSGARISVDERKKSPMDFAVWKSRKEGEPSWGSPFGEGRPGWHIECSCMAYKILGETIDIHAGGSDLIFPHHENEIAQSEGRSGKPFANYWMHSAFLNINNVKMSKSLNNFFTAREILERYDSDVIRLFMLSGHYRTQINFSQELLESAKSALYRIKNAISNLLNLSNETKVSKISEKEKIYLDKLLSYKDKFIEKMDDDFNTADGLSVIYDLIRDINSNINYNSSKELIDGAYKLIKDLLKPFAILIKEGKDTIEEEVEKLIEERQQARKDKNYKRSDEIRDYLKNKGIVLEDTPQGVRWKKV